MDWINYNHRDDSSDLTRYLLCSPSHTKVSFGIFEFTETATNTMITLPKGMENGKMEKRAHIVFLHQRHHMKLKNDVRPRIGRFFILVVSVTSNESIVSHKAPGPQYIFVSTF